jgi:uncharacterized protein
MNAMRIDLRAVSEDSRHYEFTLDEDWWRVGKEEDPIVGIDPTFKVRVKIYRVGTRFLLSGDLEGDIQAQCDRCLELYHRRIETTFKLFLAVPTLEGRKGDLELEEEDLEVKFIREEEVNLDEIIKEQIYLSFPIKSLCREDCPGLCPQCGMNLKEGRCGCRIQEGHPAFSKLKELKIDEYSPPS